MPDIKTHIANVQKLEVAKAFVYLRSDNIMQIDLKQIDELNVNDMKEIFSAVKEVSNEKKFPTIIISTGYINIDKETREYFKKEGNLYTIADAFVIDSVGLKIVANFYLKFEKPINPSKMFNSANDAIQWLKNYIE